jgi:hypothetical protein
MRGIYHAAGCQAVKARLRIVIISREISFCYAPLVVIVQPRRRALLTVLLPQLSGCHFRGNQAAEKRRPQVGEGSGMAHKMDVSDYRPDGVSSRGVITLLTGLALGAAFWGAVFLILAR